MTSLHNSCRMCGGNRELNGLHELQELHEVYEVRERKAHLSRTAGVRPSSLPFSRIWRATGEWFSLSSFGGEGWGEEVRHHSRFCGSW